jgi:alpha-D-xyloside xylohydrolase
MKLHPAIVFCFGAMVAATPLAAAEAPAFLQPGATEFRCVNGDAMLIVSREHWRLTLAGANGTSRFREAAPSQFQIGGQWVELGRVEAGEPRGDGAQFRVALGNGGTATAEVRPFGTSGFHVVVRAPGVEVGGVRGMTALGMVEEIYGFGEMWNGHVAQRGQAFDLWDRGGTPDECAYMPYYVSTTNYAWFLNYGGKVHFDVGRRRADQITFEATAHELDLTLVAGDSIPGVVRSFLSVVGLPARPPRWSFQPWFWLMSDPAQPSGKIDTLRGEHFVQMVDKLHALSIPVGVTWFEPPWQDARTSFIPNPAFSPDLKGLVAQLAQRGVRTLAWTVPSTTNAASNWREATEHHYLAAKPGGVKDGSVALSSSGELAGSYYNAIDYFNPDAARWWEQQIERSLETGIRGFKLDAGQDLETDARLFDGRVGRDVHNSYALQYNRVFFEALTKKLGDDFLMIPRAAWVGSSAYTNFKWPGDLSGTFADNGLPSSVHSSLSLAFCGIPFVSTDIGGFEDRPPPERVWLRWAQFGAMLPGMQTLHMPWWFSPGAVDHFRYLTWLHTDLTPLWMSLAHEAAQTGAPVCRPLVWSFQDDIDCWRVDDEFTVGPSLLVAPMLDPNPDRDVYLPAGTWFDFWDDRQTVHGPTTVRWFKGWEAMNRFPLYIREGAIIPLEVGNEFSGFGWRESAGFVTLAIWPKAEGASEFTLHDTEQPVRIEVNSARDRIAVSWDATNRNYLLRVHVAAKEPPLEVTAGSNRLTSVASLVAFRSGGESWCFDRETQKLWIRKLNHGAADSVTIRFVPSPQH